jgi:hypothetical protein
MSRSSGNPQIPGKKVRFSFFGRRKDTAYSEKSREKFPGKSDVFSRKFPENHRTENRNSGISKKVPKRRFLKIQPRLQSVLKRTF